jgi:1,2-phenylacetyl-CoA epoxidase PaaB subunit
MRAVTDAERVPDAGPQQCPSCNAVCAKAAVLTARFVYLRCEQCATVWTIPERRSLPRTDKPLEL